MNQTPVMLPCILHEMKKVRSQRKSDASRMKMLLSCLQSVALYKNIYKIENVIYKLSCISIRTKFSYFISDCSCKHIRFKKKSEFPFTSIFSPSNYTYTRSREFRNILDHCIISHRIGILISIPNFHTLMALFIKTRYLITLLTMLIPLNTQRIIIIILILWFKHWCMHPHINATSAW